MLGKEIENKKSKLISHIIFQFFISYSIALYYVRCDSVPLSNTTIQTYCFVFYNPIYNSIAIYTLPAIFNYNIGYLLFHGLPAIQQTVY